MKIAESWPIVALSQVADLGSGITKGRTPKDSTRLVPYLRVANVQAGHVDLGEVKYIDASEEEISRFGLERDDILMTEGGDPDKLGRGALWDGQIQPCIHQNHIFRVRLDKQRVFPPYFSRLLGTRWAVDYFLKAAKQTTGIATINKTQLSGFPVPLPPLPEQKRIAAILDKADTIRRKRQEAIRLTEELLRSAFLEMCGPLAKSYSSWPLLTIESLASSKKSSMRTGPFGSDLRHSEFVDEGIAVLGIDNAVQNRFAWGERRFITEEKYERLKRYTVFPDDVIVTIMGTTGRTAVVPKDIPPAITTKHLATITLNRGVAEPEFVAQALHRHPEVLGQIEGAHRGAIMSGLNLGLIKALTLRVPPLSAQQAFTGLSLAVRKTESTLRNAASEPLNNSLTQLAFSGEL